MHVNVLSKVFLYQLTEILVLARSGIQICSLIIPVNLGSLNLLEHLATPPSDVYLLFDYDCIYC